jgi:hypothetical protein
MAVSARSCILLMIPSVMALTPYKLTQDARQLNLGNRIVQLIQPSCVPAEMVTHDMQSGNQTNHTSYVASPCNKTYHKFQIYGTLL